MSGDVELNPGPLDAEVKKILSTTDNTTLVEDDWNAVVIECSSLASKWRSLSAYLGLKMALIDHITNEYLNDSQACWNEALKQWIERNYNCEKFGLPSWRTLLKAIALVDKLLFMKLAYHHQDLCEASSIDTSQNKPVDRYLCPIKRQHLQVIKWSDDQGKTHRFYLMDKISMAWRTLGLLLGLPISSLDSLAVEHRDNPVECCRAVLGQWLDSPPSDYPATWKGFMELLEDSQLDGVVSELKTVLVKANV